MYAGSALNKKMLTPRNAMHFFALKKIQPKNKLPFIAKAFNLSENDIYSAQMNAFKHLKIEFNAKKISKQALLDKLMAFENDSDFDFNGCGILSDSHSLTLIIYDNNVGEFINQIDSLDKKENLSV